MRFFLMIVISFSFAGASVAQTYPNRPVRFVSPYPPGGGTDIFARVIAQKLHDSLGVPVVVENRSGAGGIIGTEIVVKSPADGYTLLLGSPGPLTVSPSLYKQLPYDTLRDLAPITLIAIIPNVLVVHPSLPVKSVKDLIAYAKARPGELSFGSSGNGGSGHLQGELFKLQAGIKMVHIPYRGSIQAATALLTGEVPLSFADVLNTLPHVRSGRLRGLAVTGRNRSPAVPELPTIAEAGLPNYEAATWYGVLVPAATPKEIVTRLHSELVKALHHPEMQKRLSADGVVPIGSSPEQFAQHIRAEINRWAKVIKDANIRAD